MSDLTDLKICKRIAEIEGVELNHSVIGREGICVTVPAAGYMRATYNPLTDDALCFQLMVKYEVDISFLGGYVEAECYAADLINLHRHGDKSLNHAICMAIILSRAS